MRETPELGLCLPIQTYSDCLPHAIPDFAKALVSMMIHLTLFWNELYFQIQESNFQVRLYV